jgi:hypothetical protein
VIAAFPRAGQYPHDGLVVESLRVALGVLVVASLGVIAAYALAFAAVATVTVLGHGRRQREDPVGEELDLILARQLDRVLAEILSRRTPPGAKERPSQGGGRR